MGAQDFYVTVPTGLIQFLESDVRTKVLARPPIRGREGMTVNLGLGDDVPQPQPVFQSAAAGGIANVPTTQVQYRRVGVNLIFTPRVTYQDEIILENLQLEKSGLGPNLDVGGQTFPTFVTRTAQTTLRLRDGESNLLAGLIRDLKRTGLDKDVLVVCCTEFGRTPGLETRDAYKTPTGRDHHPHGFTVWFYGAGVKRGVIHGATDELGYAAVVDPVSVHDFHATMLHLLGVDHRRLTFRYQGLDARLTGVEGEVVKAILA